MYIEKITEKSTAFFLLFLNIVLHNLHNLKEENNESNNIETCFYY
jgi:hypothetical protein